MRFDAKSAILGGGATAVVLVGLMFAFNAWTQPSPLYGPEKGFGQGGPSEPKVAPRGSSVTLTQTQMGTVKVVSVQDYEFANQREAVGNIDFNQDRSVQVFTAYQGKVRNVFVKVGEDVAKGAPLFDIESPDLVQAESTLISAAGARKLNAKALERAHQLFEIQGIAQKDLDQAISDQQAAEAAYKAARDAVAIFGKSASEMDRIIEQRRTDPVLTVVSPIAGRVTARNAQPGLLVQPGNSPAPITVSDISTIWMQAFVTEADSPLLKVGQAVKVHAMAFPGREFAGTITTTGASIDAATHRLMVRSEVKDPKHELRPGMITSFSIRTGEPDRSAAVAADGLVREGDGTMTVWTTKDQRRFERRVVTVGQTQDGLVQILSGLAPGELVASEGALFLSNAAALAAQ
ncbi:membrane fusion protein heavy metal cation tricomponent efflux ZniB [Cupriavidus sp. HMR-1]|uniref:efflux RND transporter periplasmic adaptor subunit n=1 Tax=Cupriavidus sp. HMR-1 TaxID=1249621 RepID=UPI0002A3B0E4|nr:efflux RND transporter periplasmic adaptor subunit [Cupriavidus sp. HMR-1]EKZ95777.1 membrane fusion protein heavy metal cation tricomponent efflux ZniB [Cupriavidus sp. HMR-1]